MKALILVGGMYLDSTHALQAFYGDDDVYGGAFSTLSIKTKSQCMRV
jgi:hypothetical protein